MSIRFRLTIAAIAVILVANSLLSFSALQYLGRVWMGEVQTRVRRNPSSARAAYENQLNVIAAFLLATSRDRTLAGAARVAQGHGTLQPSPPGPLLTARKVCNLGQAQQSGD